MTELMRRREWLMSAGALVAGGLLPAPTWASLAEGGGAGKPPVARIEVQRDNYFGETLSDPYRWMENDKDSDWLPFLKGQNDYTRAVLDGLSWRETLLARVEAYSGAMTLTYAVQSAGGRLFFFQRPAHGEHAQLLVREHGKDRVLVDPGVMTVADGGHMTVDWWSASPDGERLVYGLSPNGSENSVAHIMHVATGKVLAESIADTEGARPQWLDDSSGFFYTQLTGHVGTPERYLDSQARFHRVGSDPDQDPIIMKRGHDPAIDYESSQAPFILTFLGAKYALLNLMDVRPEARIYMASLADIATGSARWQEIANFEDEVTGVDIHGDDIIVLSTKDHPRGRLLRTSTQRPTLATASELLPQGRYVIQDMKRARDGLYLQMMDGGVNRLQVLGKDEKLRARALPFDCTINGLFTRPDEPGALMLCAGWLTPWEIWSVSPNGKMKATGLSPSPGFDLSGYFTIHAYAKARDGTEIPYSLIYKKGVIRDGSAPAFIQAYGAYGVVGYGPSFLGRLLALAEAGFVVGFANVRGGGEYGREWHKAGQLENKPNTWRDLIDVCETLCRDEWTSPQHLAIGGRSAGGVAVGRAMTERPDLFAAVVDGVGWSNPLRYVAEQNSYGEEPEWGAITDAKGYQYLKAIDSYQHIVDGTDYPAVLLTTGVTDPRVAPFHVAKMTARLQAASSSGKPVLLRVDFDAGHGGSTRSQTDREAADTYAFLLWQALRHDASAVPITKSRV